MKNRKQNGFALIVIIIAILIITVIAFGFFYRPGLIKQSREIKNKATNDLEKINNDLIENNRQIQNNLENRN